MTQPTPVVLIGTFNMSQRSIEQDLSDWLATHPSLSSFAPETPPSSPTSSTASTVNHSNFISNSNAASNTATTHTNAAPIMPDIVAVALQEFAPYPDAFIHDTYQIRARIDELANLIIQTLHKTCPGYRFSLVSQSAQVGMIMFILTRDGSMTEFVDRVSNASVGTGPVMMGNKGAIATKLTIRLPASSLSSPAGSSYSSTSITTTTTTTTTTATAMGTTTYTGIHLGTTADDNTASSSSNNTNYNSSNNNNHGVEQQQQQNHSRTSFDICFINAHLSAHLKNIKRRNDDYLAICRRMVFLNDKDNHVEGLLFEHQERLTSAASSSDAILSAAVGEGSRRSVGPYESLEDLNAEDDSSSIYQVDIDSRPLLGNGGSKKASKGSSKKSDSRQYYQYGRDDNKKGIDWEESIFSCDYIFWTGDLNYRLDLAQSDGTLSSYKTKKNKQKSQSTEDLLSGSTMPNLTAKEIVYAIKSGQLRQLYSHDQLSAQRKTLNVFKGFHEAPLAFPPTYKYQMGSVTDYDISKRVPAWTDRVLWFVHPKDAASADEAQDDELDAWDEHSKGLGTGILPLESSPSTKIRSGNYSSMASSMSSWNGSKSRGTFTSLSKRGFGPVRGAVTAGTFQQSPLSTVDNYQQQQQQPLSTARSHPSLTSLSSRNSNSHLQQAAAGLTQSLTTQSPSGEPCTTPLMIHYYTSHPHYVSSDHKPVSALFTLLPHNLATSHHEPSPYGIDPKWRIKKWLGKKLTTIAGHMLRWGFIALGLGIIVYLSVLIRRHLHGW
ncbi:Synaptojanin-2 [Linnemannia zychae]|nr:Synaptojanin-2 [Linnemannia zychae]